MGSQFAIFSLAWNTNERHVSKQIKWKPRAVVPTIINISYGVNEDL